MGRYNRSSRKTGGKAPALPVAVQEAVIVRVTTITQRLIDHIPFPNLGVREIDDLAATPSANKTVRNYAKHAPERFIGSNYMTLCLMDDPAAWYDSRHTSAVIPEGTYKLSMSVHGEAGNRTGTNMASCDDLFMPVVNCGVGINNVPMPDADPEKLALLRAYAENRYKVGLQVAAVRRLVKTVTEGCTTVPSLIRVWPQLLPFCAQHHAVKSALAEKFNSRGRIPQGWDTRLDRAIPGANTVLGRGSLLEDRVFSKGEFETRVLRHDTEVTVSWGYGSVIPA